MRRCIEQTGAPRGWASRYAILLLVGVAQALMAQNGQSLKGEGGELQALETGEYVWTTEAYEARVGPDGNCGR